MMTFLEKVNQANQIPSNLLPAWPLPKGKFQDLLDRAISETTCRLYDYEVGNYRDRQEHTDHPLSHLAHVRAQDGTRVATHVRLPHVPKKEGDKKIKWAYIYKGAQKGAQLFGQHIGSGSHLIITEGEIDAMSVHEAYCARSKGVVAVSITSGVHACKANLQANLKYIESFDRVTVFFDNDEPGREWGKQAVELIGPKARLVTGLAYKDANEAWVARDGDAIRRAIDNAGKAHP